MLLSGSGFWSEKPKKQNNSYPPDIFTAINFLRSSALPDFPWHTKRRSEKSGHHKYQGMMSYPTIISGDHL